MIPLLPNERTLRRLERLRLEWRAIPAASAIGSRRGQRPGSTREFLGLRPYEAGDDVRDLDWAATSRFDRPYVRVYRREMDASLLLLIDSSASMAFGDPSKLAYAQALACALGYLALAHHDRVGAVAFTDQVAGRLPSGRGRRQWAALRDLVSGVTARGPTAFSDVPAALPGVGSLRGLAVILSDFYPPEAFAAGLKLLARYPLSAVAIHLLSPQESDPALEGEVELVDLESGEVRRGRIAASERAAYRTTLATLEAQIAAVCRESGIRYLQISTAVPLVRCLEETLVKAKVLRRGGA